MSIRLRRRTRTGPCRPPAADGGADPAPDIPPNEYAGESSHPMATDPALPKPLSLPSATVTPLVGLAPPAFQVVGDQAVGGPDVARWMSRSQRGRLPSASPTCSKAGRTCAALAACGDGGEADMTPAGAPRGLPSPATQPAAPRGAAVRWTASPAARVRRDRFCLSWMSSPTPGGGGGSVTPARPWKWMLASC